MKKCFALNDLNYTIQQANIPIADLLTKKSVEKVIRQLMADNADFENIVFDLGVTTLAKTYLKSRNN